MAKKIIIAELDINVDELIKSTVNVKKELDDLKEKQKALTSLGETSSAQFVQNASDLKLLQSAYTQNVKAITDNSQAIADGINKQDLMTLALNEEVTTRNEAMAQNKILTKLRNDVNVTTAEGAAELKLLNDKIDQNNNFLTENSDQLTKQKMNIGNYGSALDGLDSILAKFGVNGAEARNVVQGFTSTVSKGASDVTDFANNVGNGISKLIGFKTQSMLAAEQQATTNVATTAGTTANTALAESQVATAAATNVTTLSLRGFALALAATGIGLIVIAVGLLVNYFKDFDPLLDKIERGFAALGAVVNVLSTAFASLFLSSEKNSGSFDNLGNKMANAANAAMKLKAAQQDLEDLQKSSVLTNAQLAQQGELALIMSKDKSKTEAERIALLKEAEAIEVRRFKINEALAKQELANAIEAAVQKAQADNRVTQQSIENLKLRGTAYANFLLQEGILTEKEVEAITKAETAIVGVKSESQKILEKNINTQNKLIDDQQEKRLKANEDAKKDEADRIARQQKRLDDLVKIKENEADFYKETNRFREEDLSKATDFAKKDLDVLKEKLKAKQLTQLEYDTEVLRINNDLTAKKTEIENAELEKTKEFEQRKKDLRNEIELQKVTDEEANALLKITQDLEKDILEIDSLKLSIEQKDQLKKDLAEKYTLDAEAIAQRGAAKLAKITADATISEINYTKTKNEALLGLAGQLSKQLIGMLGDSVGAQIAGIALDAILQVAKLNIATSSAVAINTANGVALAVPTANASVTAAGVLNAGLLANSRVQQAVILGSAALAAGQKIVDKKFAGGGVVVQGASHDNGGIPIHVGGKYFGEMQGGELLSVLNKGATNQLMAFNQAFGDSDVNANNPVGFMAGGGILATAVTSQSPDFNQIVKAIESIPAPIVSVQDIILETNNRVSLVEMANS